MSKTGRFEWEEKAVDIELTNGSAIKVHSGFTVSRNSFKSDGKIYYAISIDWPSEIETIINYYEDEERRNLDYEKIKSVLDVLNGEKL